MSVATVRRADTADSFRLVVDIPEATLDAVPNLGAVERATAAYVAALAEVGIDTSVQPTPPIAKAREKSWGVLGILGFVIGVLFLVTLIGVLAWSATSIWAQVIG